MVKKFNSSARANLKSLHSYTANKKIKVVCAMSGGIDSSVAAALLKKAGFNVVGVFMKFWLAPSEVGYNRCCSPDSERRARQVAKILGIPFYVFNFEKEFKKRVVDYFLKGCKEGTTPNPCVVCNKEIKFGLLLEKALKLGADFVATGHYARLRRGRLYQGKDKKKDQSYFLWQLDQNQLKRILFPIGDYTKDEVKKLAREFKLPFARVPESMEICFAAGGINDFLKNHLKVKKGKIVDTRGGALGEHNGLFLYTLGQRKGIGLSGGPYYVAAKNFKRNALIISRDQKDLLGQELRLKDINLISGKAFKPPIKVKVKIRYRSQPAQAFLSKNKLVFERLQRAITPGQSAVFYSGEQVFGGGIIV